MTEIEKLISIWHLTDKNISVPLSHEKACGELEAICPERPGQASLNILRFSNLVEANCQGEYILTFRGINLRRTIPDQIQEEIKQEKRTGHEWDRFRKVLSYYIDCVHFQERTQQYLLHADLNKRFFVPLLGTNWLKDLGNTSQIKIRFDEKQRAAVQHLLTRKDDDEEIYIGYPLEARLSSSGKDVYYTPIGLIPVDITDSSKTTIEMNIRIDEAEINQSYLEFAFPKERRNGVINTILNLHAKDEFSGMIDLKQALPLLETDIPFNPDDMDFILPVLPDGCKKKLSNAAVLFVGQPLRYSKTLKRELKYIRDEISDETLDETALAYIFREPVLRNKTPEKAFMPLPFIESNPEQMAAISAALNQHSSKITGPPGTGKSQVAVNIIANLIFNGKTVLFASKNRKAVLAIQQRSQRVIDKIKIPLVNFCIDEDETVKNPWYSQKLADLIREGEIAEYEFGEEKIFKVNESADRWRNIEKSFIPRNEVLSAYEMIVYKCDECKRKQESLFVVPDSISRKNLKLLSYHVKNLANTPLFKFYQLWARFEWSLFGKRKNEKAEAFIKRNYRDLWNNAIDIHDLKERFAKFTVLFDEYERLQKQKSELEFTAKKLQPLDHGEQLLTKAMADINSILQDALIVSRCKKIKELACNTELRQELENIMSFMRASTSPAFFQRLDSEEAQKAEDGFKIFSRFYPGWATSLLSLTKASPCIPSLFDSVIIDEASQCDPASVIPALFRAKSIVFIGDSNQFPPVVDMKPLRNDFLKTKNGMTSIGDQRFDFLNTAAFDLSPEIPILLREHFRCAEEIADYFNEEFYANQLKVRTSDLSSKRPPGMVNNAVIWKDVPNSSVGEFEEVKETLQQLVENQYKGSVGIITPFKKYADELDTKLRPFAKHFGTEEEPFLVKTANGFQGGERDLIIFVLGYNDNLTKGEFWYAESPENRYIYNVAVSRARACLIVVGDKKRCANSNVSVLSKLAQLPRPIKNKLPEPGDELKFDSVWEEKLYNALLAVGIETITQYPLVGRRLDLAFVSEKVKIDIEVDGVHYHTNQYGTRKNDDHYRDLQVGAAGWLVKRFWVYQLRDNMDDCVKQIKHLIKNGSC